VGTDTNDPAGEITPKNEALKFSQEDGVSDSRAFCSVRFRPGLMLTISRPLSRPPATAFFDIDQAPIQFGFTYSGRHRCTYSRGDLRNQAHEMQAGSNGIFYLPKTRGAIERPADTPPLVIAIIASPRFLSTYFENDMDQLPGPFRKKLETRQGESMAWFGPRNQTKHHLLAQIMNCPYKGGMRTLFLESRALELLALQMHDYSLSETRRSPALPPLSPADAERIRHARDILVNDLENPPSLTELAARAGLNERKLKTGFRQVFATSVFGYFREHRMQKAYELLQQGDLNVTEAAFAVGYRSLSHFSQAFKGRFGTLPKAFAAQQNRLRNP